MKVRDVKNLIKAIEKHKKGVAEHRDALREIFEEIDMLDDDFTEGVECLDSAIEFLSRSV